MDQPRWLTVEEVAAQANLDLPTVLTAADSGRLPAYLFGPKLRFRPDDVAAWLRGDAPPPAPDYPDGLKQEAVGRVLLEDDPEQIAVDLGLPRVYAWRVRQWGQGAPDDDRP